MNTFKYEVAFSLCKLDIEYAKELSRNLNPSLQDSVFLYSDKQQELISKIGPEKFSDIFINQSRVVVILYRKEYGSTYYTNLEKDSIIERLGKAIDGYNFIFLIPMIQGEKPSWYPTTRIYADPYNFSIEELAKFIEFKVIEREGVINPISFIDKISNFKDSLTEKQKRIRFLDSDDSLKSIDTETEKLRQIFEKNVCHIQGLILPFTLTTYKSENPKIIGFGNYYLVLKIEDNSLDNFRITSSLCYSLIISICTVHQYNYINIGRPKDFILQTIYRFNSEGEGIYGWSEEIKYEKTIEKTLHPYLFKDPIWNYYYDIKKFYSSESIIDFWFSKLFDFVKKEVKLR